MSGPDGIEERTAALESRLNYDHDIAADRADEDRDFIMDATTRGLTTSTVKLQLQRDELAATLRDLALGATMMLEPVMGASGAFEQFAKEVQRVARAGLKEAGL